MRARADADWLALREPVDARARSPELVELLRPHLPASGMVVHDLGCGTGSMARWLAPQLAGPQHWVLHERDEALLPQAVKRAPRRARDGAAVTTEGRLDDITRLGRRGLSGASLLVASALLDMMTGPELTRLMHWIVGAGAPALISLSVTGRVELAPADPLDTAIDTAFNDHQRRLGPQGPLLGPGAVDAAMDLLRGHGLDVAVRASRWGLGPDERELVAAWFAGWLAAAREQRPSLRDRTADYEAARLDQIRAGQLRVVVDHEDVLALPGVSGMARRP